jgi:hypothetical protein
MAKIVDLSGARPADLLQLRIELAWLKPAIWRRVVVPEMITLAKLHKVIQAAMGWTDSHLHEFEIGGSRYGIPDPDWDMDGAVIPEKRITLATSLAGAKSFRYTYDFGDGWEHRIKVEKSLPAETYPRTPLCTAGANACPPEDVGGPPGYVDFLEAISNPAHPEHEDMLTWCGGSFNPKTFNIERANQRLQRIKL